MLEHFHVVTAVFNPCRWHSRRRLYRAFARYCQDHGASLWTVELALGERPFEVTERGRTDHLQLRSRSELWHKERLLNLALQRLPDDWRYVAWIDADVRFARIDWAIETVHRLQHFDVVQMFDEALDLGPNSEALDRHVGFVKAWEDTRVGWRPSVKGKGNGVGTSASGSRSGHPGYAWAARREAMESLGGLLDVGILGAGDHHMAQALIGSVERSCPHGVTAGYRGNLATWQERAERSIARNVGHVPGLLLHYWHGRKRDRSYLDRWRILVDHGFDPSVDLMIDTQGCYRLREGRAALAADIRRYFAARNEDGNEL